MQTKSQAFKNVNNICVVKDNKFPWENPSSLQYSHPSVVRSTFGTAVDKYIHQNMHDNCGHTGDGTETVGSSNSTRRLASSLGGDGGHGSESSDNRMNINSINQTLPATIITNKTTTTTNAAHCVPYDSFSYVAIPGTDAVDIEKDKDNDKAKLTHHAHSMMPLIPSVS